MSDDLRNVIRRDRTSKFTTERSTQAAESQQEINSEDDSDVMDGQRNGVDTDVVRVAIGNLPKTYLEEEVLILVKPIGTKQHVKIQRDKYSNRAVVGFSSEPEANQCVNFIDKKEVIQKDGAKRSLKAYIIVDDKNKETHHRRKVEVHKPRHLARASSLAPEKESRHQDRSRSRLRISRGRSVSREMPPTNDYHCRDRDRYPHNPRGYSPITGRKLRERESKRRESFSSNFCGDDGYIPFNNLPLRPKVIRRDFGNSRSPPRPPPSFSTSTATHHRYGSSSRTENQHRHRGDYVRCRSTVPEEKFFNNNNWKLGYPVICAPSPVDVIPVMDFNYPVFHPLHNVGRYAIPPPGPPQSAGTVHNILEPPPPPPFGFSNFAPAVMSASCSNNWYVSDAMNNIPNQFGASKWQNGGQPQKRHFDFDQY